jgi:hypothetical protein
MPIICEFSVPHNGLILDVAVTSYEQQRPMPFAQTPDCPGYDDPGDPGEIEFYYTAVAIDCEKTFIEAGFCIDEDAIRELVFGKMSGI